MGEIDPNLLQDFLTESSELIEQLDADLVRLESADGKAAAELCNGCFRALHTIKGAASFLGLGAITRFAHAAEDALNRLRKGDLALTPEIMDAMLRSADVVRGQVQSLAAGEVVRDGPPALVETLHAIAGGAARPPADAVAASPAPEPNPDGATAEPLQLPPQKVDLLEFMVQDMRDYLVQLDEVFEELGSDATRADAAQQLASIGDALSKTTDFFELDDLSRVVSLLGSAAMVVNEASAELLPELVIRLRVARRLIQQQAEALAASQVLHWPLELFCERCNRLCQLEQIESQFVGLHDGDVENVMILDGLIRDAIPDAPADTEPDTVASPAEAAGADVAAAAESARDARAPLAEQTIRVEVARLESLLNLVGQLVLNKNRMLGLTRTLRDVELPQELKENLASASGELDHLMSELQIGVMRTRMQPLAKLFDRYPRVIRDLARTTGKKIDLIIEGRDTEVDKSVLELLADPLVHLLRNSADHGIEQPEQRLAKGKCELGVIRLTAEHQGSHVRVAIIDDGKGLDREVLGRKAVEKGLISAEQLSQMSDREVYRLIFAPGFSTADKVSDLSGRGVGMDVVNANVQKLNGQVNVFSKTGEGTTLEILIPLTVAIMPAMVVAVGSHLYSIPLQSIVEIVRPEAQAVHRVNGQQVMRLRDQVLPLINLQERLGEPASERGGRFAVIVTVAGTQAGLLVDRLVGQQEIVIKPLDDDYTQGGPFSGATIREDGQVSLILDVLQLVRSDGANQPKLEKKVA